MNQTWDALLGSMQRASNGLSDKEIKELEHQIERPLPKDYLDFLRWSNGAHGELGNQHLVLHTAAQLVESNNQYKTLDNDFIVFGSDGGGEAYAFDYKHSPAQVVQLPFIPYDRALAEVRGASFSQFLSWLAAQR
jgi:hypothetical protein